MGSNARWPRGWRVRRRTADRDERTREFCSTDRRDGARGDDPPSEDGTGDRSVDSVLPELASVLMGGDDGSPPSERVVLELLSTLLLETGASDPDLASLRSALGSERTGARALVALFVANLVAMTLGAWISRERAPPIPDEIRGPEGRPSSPTSRCARARRRSKRTGS
ncbi:hypothetical protein [Halalkalicoccus salilacus]|uniref:hypothetical protein n=1 Tax=Halalkalicoccus sp. GCM10025704 TaxID=3252662 RepID=UPI00360EA59D